MKPNIKEIIGNEYVHSYINGNKERKSSPSNWFKIWILKILKIYGATFYGCHMIYKNWLYLWKIF